MYQTEPEEMDIDDPDSINYRRRITDDFLYVNEAIFGRSIVPDPNPPRILRRHHHRRHNIASRLQLLPPPPPRPLVPRRPAVPERFSVYKAILRHPNLFFQFALRLPYQTIIDLYAIDKEFHYRLNKYSLSLIHDYAKYHVPLASWIFSWGFYPRLCITDPMLRPMDDREWLARDVPGFRWIGMLLSREKIIKRILTHLGLEGHRVPARCAGTLMKYWVLMALQTTNIRLGFLADKEIWTDADILVFQLFLVKLDMRFGNPITGSGVCEFSHMLLTQQSLAQLDKVLSGEKKMNYDDATEMLLHTYSLDDLDTDANPWLEDDEHLARDEWMGLLSLEDWDSDGAKMPSPVDMVIAEGVRRGLHVQKYLLDFVMYGYTDKDTGDNIPTPRKWRKDKNVVLLAQGLPAKEAKKNLLARLEH